MDPKQYNYDYGSAQVADPNKNFNISLVHSQSSKRLTRKPSAEIFKSPKARMSAISSLQGQTSHADTGKLNRFSRNSINAIGGNFEDLIKIGYISPKFNKSGRFSRVQQSPIHNLIEMTSIEQIETQEEIIQMSPVSSASDFMRSRLSRTGKQFYQQPDSKKSIFIDQSRTHSELSQPQTELNFVKEQNKQLLNSNKNLSNRVIDLKEENQYLYLQIEGFNEKLSKQKKENQELKETNARMHERIACQQQQLARYKQAHRDNETSCKNYQVLQHVYKKIKFQSQIYIRKNESLNEENTKLRNKVMTLKKLLEQVPISSKKQKSKQKGRQLSPAYNKQNFEKSTAKVSNYNIKINVYNKHSRKQDGFFQLSPE